MSNPKSNGHLDLIIRATNGSPWETSEFKSDETVEKVTSKALKHFEHEKIMQAGEYDLVLVIDGAAGPALAPQEKLEDVEVREGSILALTPHEPQVDG
jgi:hypothetical protein